MQGHFWGMCRYIHFWRNIHLCVVVVMVVVAVDVVAVPVAVAVVAVVVSQEDSGHQSSGARAPELWCPHLFFSGFLITARSFMLTVF